MSALRIGASVKYHYKTYKDNGGIENHVSSRGTITNFSISDDGIIYEVTDRINPDHQTWNTDQELTII